MTQNIKLRQMGLHIGLTLMITFMASAAYAGTASQYIRGATWKNYHTKKAFQQTINYKNVNTAKLNAAIFHETNVRRVKHGLRPLSYHATLERAAQLHADLMVRDKFFAHHHPRNKRFRSPVDRNKAVGVLNPMPAENIAVAIAFPYRSKQSVYHRGNGQYSLTPRGRILPPHTYTGLARSVLTQWMNSPGHRRNILNKKALSLGCAARFTWHNNFPAFMSVQNFQFYKPVRTSARTRAVTQPAPTTRRATAQPRRDTVRAKKAVIRRPAQPAAPSCGQTTTRRAATQRRTAAAAPKATYRTTTHKRTVITRKKTITRYINGVKHVEVITEVEELPPEVDVRDN